MRPMPPSANRHGRRKREMLDRIPMLDAWFRVLRRMLVPLALGLPCAVSSGCSCDDSSAEDIRRAAIAEGCVLDSDCAENLVCAWQRCHVQCQTTKDCRNAAVRFNLDPSVR